MHWTFSDFMKARSFAYNNKESITKSRIVSCYYCIATYNACDVVDFTSGDNTAICTLCGADSILGDASGLPIENIDFLEHMHWYGFCHIDVNGTIRTVTTPTCCDCYAQTDDAYCEK